MIVLVGGWWISDTSKCQMQFVTVSVARRLRVGAACGGHIRLRASHRPLINIRSQLNATHNEELNFCNRISQYSPAIWWRNSFVRIACLPRAANRTDPHLKFYDFTAIINIWPYMTPFIVYRRHQRKYEKS